MKTLLFSATAIDFIVYSYYNYLYFKLLFIGAFGGKIIDEKTIEKLPDIEIAEHIGTLVAKNIIAKDGEIFRKLAAVAS